MPEDTQSQQGNVVVEQPDGTIVPSEDPLAGLAEDPILGPMLAENPDLLAGLMGGTGSLEPPSLVESLIGSAMDVMGRYGMIGSRFTASLPPWAQHLAPTTLNNPDFDPYLGIVSEAGDERVYMGDKTVKRKKKIPFEDPAAQVPMGMQDDPDYDGISDNHQATKVVTKDVDKTMTVTQVANAPYTWSEEEITDAMKRMRAAGINVTSFDGESGLVSVWGSLVNRAAMTYSLTQGKTKVTPWDVLDMYKSEAQAAGSFINFENGTQSITRKSVSDISEGQAWYVLQQQLSQMLGRDPSDQEVRDFSYRMNQLAAQNPSISKTIAQYKGGRVVSENTVTKGGFESADMVEAAYENAQNDPEYGAYQAASTYFNAALSALGAIGSVG